MAYSEHVEDFPQCPEIPHAILNVQIVYCPHDSGYTMSVMLGDQTEKPWSDHTYRYGPFDEITDVVADLAGWLRVVARRRLLDSSLAERDKEWREREAHR